MTVQCAYVPQALVLLLQSLQASQLDDEDDDPFDAQIWEEEMLEENVPYLRWGWRHSWHSWINVIKNIFNNNNKTLYTNSFTKKTFYVNLNMYVKKEKGIKYANKLF